MLAKFLFHHLEQVILVFTIVPVLILIPLIDVDGNG